MPLCSVALYGNTLLFKRRLVYAENPQKIWGLNIIHLYTSASVLTRSILKRKKKNLLQLNSTSLLLTVGPLQWLWCVERTRVEEISSLNVPNSPITVRAPSPHRSAFTGPVRPEASANRSRRRFITTVPLQRKVSPLQLRRWEVPCCDADSSTALYLWALYQGQTVIIQRISLKTKGAEMFMFFIPTTHRIHYL